MRAHAEGHAAGDPQGAPPPRLLEPARAAVRLLGRASVEGGGRAHGPNLPATAADKLPTEATWLLKEATKLLANNDNGDLNLEETPSASQFEVQPHTGSLIALWVALDKHFYAARVRGRRAVVDERSGRPSYTLHVRYYDTPEECRPPHASPLPPQREERSVDGAKLIRSMEPPQRSSQRTWYPLAAMPSSRDWLGILWEAAMSQMGVSEEEEVQVRAKAAFERAL